MYTDLDKPVDENNLSDFEMRRHLANNHLKSLMYSYKSILHSGGITEVFENQHKIIKAFYFDGKTPEEVVKGKNNNPQQLKCFAKHSGGLYEYQKEKSAVFGRVYDKYKF